MHFCPGRVNEFGKSTCSAGSRYSGGVSVFRVNVIAVDPRNERRTSPAVEALVDTGSELTWLPADTLCLVGISPRRKRQFVTATGERVERDVGYAMLRAEGYETIDEVVFGEAADSVLLGVRTIEGFGVAVDNIGHRFVARTTLVHHCG